MNAGIIGAAGYTGAELIRLLAGHPQISALILGSVSRPGETIASVFPQFLEGLSRGPVLESPEALIRRADIVFGALPAGAGDPYAKACLDRGISFIDLSADFRFGADEKTYTAWYGKGWQYPELRTRSVYGLPELNRERIRELAASGPVIIGNPGCYPTAVSLACFPALAGSLQTAPGTIIADAVSGVTGAGREPGRAYHFPECTDSVSAYKVGCHRHTPEISRNLSQMAGRPVPVVFSPHLGPYNRGILATVYIPLAAGKGGVPAETVPPSEETAAKAGKIREAYAAFYRDEPFVRVLPEGLAAATNRVRHSNYCDLSVHLEEGGSVLIVEAAIDNMVKGAAGQAVQNMNILCGFDETSGLCALPALF